MMSLSAKMVELIKEFEKETSWENILLIRDSDKILWMNKNAEQLFLQKYCIEIEKEDVPCSTDILPEDVNETIKQCKVKEDYAYRSMKAEHYVCCLLEVGTDEENELLHVYGINVLNSIQAMSRELKRINSYIYELKEVIKSSFDGIYVTDCNGTTLMVNNAHERISGIDKSYLLNRKINEMVEEGIFSGFITNRVVEEKRPITILQEVGDTQKNLLITGNPVYNRQNEIVKVVTNVRDVTELINLQKELKATKAIVEKYKGELLSTPDLNRVVVDKGSKFAEVLYLAKKVAAKDSTVLILGETGVGKEVVARYIFNNSGRNEKNYLKINCGAIPVNLLESELFGYVRGAFTGADANGKLGLFEIANNGTLFLDEIGELPLHLQASLLRVLQDGEVTRIGDTKSRKVNVRIIAATNRNLKCMMKKGEFRSDLYYRLNVVSITIPPLRERKDEIPALVEDTVVRLNEKYNEKKVVTDGFIKSLLEKDWPGNIRELENYVEKYFVIADDDIIDDPCANRKYQEVKNSMNILDEDKIIPMQEAIERVEREQIMKAMKLGKSTYKAAELLGMSQSTFFRRYRKLIIDGTPGMGEI